MKHRILDGSLTSSLDNFPDEVHREDTEYTLEMTKASELLFTPHYLSRPLQSKLAPNVSLENVEILNSASASLGHIR